jgi:hypothetical protein
MTDLPLALSIHSFIDKIGADAGFAAIVGIALLLLLLLSQARETALLRERAAAAAARIRELEGQLAQLARAAPSARAAAPAAAASTGARPFARGAPAASSVGPPAGVAAPPLADATRLIAPLVNPGPASPPPLRAPVLRSPAPAPAAAAARAPAVPAPAAPAPVAPAPVARAPAAAAPAPAPVAPAPVASSVAPVAPPPVAPATVAGAGNGARQAAGRYAGDGADEGLEGGVARAGGAPALAELRTARRALPPEFSLTDPPPRLPWRRLWPALALFAVVAVGAIAGVALLASGGGRAPRTRPNATGVVKVDPNHVTVAVLNGTAINQLAHGTAQRLAQLGFQISTTGNAPNQTHTNTRVEFLSSADRLDALAVAKTLHLPGSDVVPVSSADEQVACPSSGPCPAQVIVVAGPQLSRYAPAPTASATSATSTVGTSTAGTSTVSTVGTSTAGAPTTATSSTTTTPG